MQGTKPTRCEHGMIVTEKPTCHLCIELAKKLSESNVTCRHCGKKKRAAARRIAVSSANQSMRA